MTQHVIKALPRFVQVGFGAAAQQRLLTWEPVVAQPPTDALEQQAVSGRFRATWYFTAGQAEGAGKHQRDLLVLATRDAIGTGNPTEETGVE
jgi:hypothetical protein